MTPIINSYLTFPAKFEIKKGIMVDFTSQIQPVFTNSSMSVYFMGECRTTNESKHPHREMMKVPFRRYTTGKAV